MKKFFALLTAAVLLFSVSAFSVNAETNNLEFYPEFSVDNAKRGDTVVAYIKWKNNPTTDGWAEGTIRVLFDNTVLHVEKSGISESTIVAGKVNEDDDGIIDRAVATNLERSKTETANNNGEFGVTMAFPYRFNQDESGIVVKITFVVLDEAAFGETTVEVKADEKLYTEDGKLYSGAFPKSEGKIFVTCGNHQFGGFTETKAATCTDGNSGYKACSVCGYKEVSSTVPALGHLWKYSSEEDNGKFYHSATCTRAGCNDKIEKTECTLSWSHDDDANTHSATCSVCKLAQTVDCTMNWSCTLAPTWKSYGTRECECPICNHHYTDNTTLVPGTVKDVVITDQPTKVSYNAGESFNPAGMKVTVSYTNADYDDTVLTDFSGVSFTERKTAHGKYDETFSIAGNDLTVSVTKASDIGVEFSAGTATGKAGDTVTVSVSWSGNDKSMNGATAYLDFDKNKLEVVSITKGSGVLTPNSYDIAVAESVSDANKNGFASFMLATDGAQNASGELYKVEFKIKDGTASGDIPLALRVVDVISTLGDVDTKDNFCKDGKITVSGGLLGDANGDGQIDTADATAILRYIIRVGEIDMTLADCNGMKGVDTADATAILRYIIRAGTLTAPED